MDLRDARASGILSRNEHLVSRLTLQLKVEKIGQRFDTPL
jgi:hypothetical protein